MSSHLPKRFGKYLVLDRIAVGGMGEVYKCKIIGDEGFEKLAVLKRTLPHLHFEEEVIKSFIEEAKLSALLQHSNIVQIYDFGTIDGAYYIAMEHLFGKDLGAVSDKAQEKNLTISLENILYIVSQICAGLDYAHKLKDPNGKKLNIIHRDISPQNIFITYEGQVKIIDFGIAKAACKSKGTRHGIIKGKAGYMSPEQAEGKVVDNRTDIFSTGILLYELVTGKPMFPGSFFQILAKMRNAEFEPPERITEDLPPKVYAILHRALAKEPSQRYQSASAMLADIEDCIHELSFRPSARKLSAYVKELLKDELESNGPNRVNSTNSKAESISVAATVMSTIQDHQESITGSDKDETSSEWKKKLAWIASILEVITRNLKTFRIKKKRLVVAGITTLLLLSFAAFSIAYSLRTEQFSNESYSKNEKEIQLLLAKAKKHLDNYRLTVPVKNNARYYYQKVLERDPQNQAARQGYYKIANRYARLAEKSMEKFRYERAKHYVDTGLSIVPEHERLLALKKQVDASLPSRIFHSLKSMLSSS